MSHKNQFVRCSGDDLLRLEEEYNFIGRQTLRVEGGLSVLALPLRKPKKKAPARTNKRRDEDEEKVKPSRDQRPKRS